MSIGNSSQGVSKITSITTNSLAASTARAATNGVRAALGGHQAVKAQPTAEHPNTTTMAIAMAEGARIHQGNRIETPEEKKKNAQLDKVGREEQMNQHDKATKRKPKVEKKDSKRPSRSTTSIARSIIRGRA